IDASPAREHVIDQPRAIISGSDVRAAKKRVGRRADEPDRFPRRVLIAGIIDNNRITVPGKFDADAPADAATAAGDEGDGMNRWHNTFAKRKRRWLFGSAALCPL